jgi:hypothetical protein
MGLTCERSVDITFNDLEPERSAQVGERTPAPGGDCSGGGILKGWLDIENACAGGPDSVFQGLRNQSVIVHRDTLKTDVVRLSDRSHPEKRGFLNKDCVPGFGQMADSE